MQILLLTFTPLSWQKPEADSIERRMQHKMTRLSTALTTLMLLTAAACPWVASAQSATAVPKMALTELTGTWYEIAALPGKQEKKCVGNAVMLAAGGDKSGHFQLVYACKTKPGYTDASNVDGKRQDKAEDGKLKLGSIWPFYRKFWVLAIAPDDSWVLIGTPNHKKLWIYSKKTTLESEILTQLEALAATQGFPTAKLTLTPHGLPIAE